MTQPENTFDSFIERLITDFKGIPNFHLIETDETGKRLFNLIVLRMTEVSSYKDLVTQHFIPSAHLAMEQGKKSINESKYNHLIDTNSIDFEETIYETIRIAYVSTFHKLENFIEELLEIPNWFYESDRSESVPLRKWTKETYGFDFKDWRRFHITYKFNWIANCVKHYDGYPVKTPLPENVKGLNPTERIRINTSEYDADCQELLNLYSVYLQSMFMFSMIQFSREVNLSSQSDQDKQMDLQVQKFLNQLDALK